mgnify:CR=1 FL=1
MFSMSAEDTRQTGIGEGELLDGARKCPAGAIMLEDETMGTN